MMPTPRLLLSLLLLGVSPAPLLAADSPAAPVAEVVKHSQWNGFERLDFKVDGRDALLVVPKTPAAENPWIWRTEFFGHEPQADLALLAKGFHVAYVDVQNMYGSPVAMGHMEKFHTRLTTEWKLSTRPVLEGFSRGGLFALNWAVKHSNLVSSLYLDAPVCDFKSWPAGFGKGKNSPDDWQRCKKQYGAGVRRRSPRL